VPWCRVFVHLVHGDSSTLHHTTWLPKSLCLLRSSQPSLLHCCCCPARPPHPATLSSHSHLTGLFLGWAHTQLLPTPARLTNIIRVSTAISNTGNLPLVMVMSFVKNPNLPFNTASEAELAVSYVMLGWFYATMIQMPLGEWGCWSGCGAFVCVNPGCHCMLWHSISCHVGLVVCQDHGDLDATG
jgi:hypothetical protein